MSDHAALHVAILDSLDGLLRALELDQVDENRFRVVAEPGRFDRIFGGQTLAQALLAASHTTPGRSPHSLHAYFVEAGTPGHALDLVVDRVRDGRSMSTRRVTVLQRDRPLLVAIASFQVGSDMVGRDVGASPSPVDPQEVPLLQDWVDSVPPEFVAHSRVWVDHPPPIEMRIGEAPSFLNGPSGEGTRSHWMRLPRAVDGDPLLHTALLAYASDYLLLDMAFRSHPEPYAPSRVHAVSLDHAVWFHRPVQFDGWHLHTQETVVHAADRALVRGSIHDEGGHLVATVAQEVLVRRAAAAEAP